MAGNDSNQNKGGMGFIQGLELQFKLVLRLLGDSRINPLLKLLPFSSVLYLLIPDILIGPIDDAAIIWLGVYLFFEMCPDEVVQEHRAIIEEEMFGTQPDVDIIDGKFVDIKPETPTSEKSNGGAKEFKEEK